VATKEEILANLHYCPRLQARITLEQCRRNHKRAQKGDSALDQIPAELGACRGCPGLNNEFEMGNPRAPKKTSKGKKGRNKPAKKQQKAAQEPGQDKYREPGPSERRCKACRRIKGLGEFRPHKFERHKDNPPRCQTCIQCERELGRGERRGNQGGRL